MNFNSLPFLALAVSTFVLYYMPWLRRYQVSILIAASLVFYAYGQLYLLTLLLFSVVVNGICSLQIIRAVSRRRKLSWAVGGVIFNLAVLALFKYGRLLAQAAFPDISSMHGPASFLLEISLPIGISFYTFHGISLVVDVLKRGDPNIEGNIQLRPSVSGHLHQTLLYLTFFPQLIAGPIVKAHYFYPQITPKEFKNIDWELSAKALITGYFLKLVVADNLQDQTFWITYPYFLNFSSLNLVVFLFGYSIQIFADFAGYSLIAIGLALLLGYKLPQNFNFPYISQSFSEFWTRWHMSLSSFLREYLYYPLGGNRKGSMRTYLNLMVVMALGGLWHGAAWSYALWGAWHGAALAIERRFRETRFYRSSGVVMMLMRTALVFAVVSFAWLLFKLPNFGEVTAYLSAAISNVRKTPNLMFVLAITIYSTPVIAYHLFHQAQCRCPGALAGLKPGIYGAMLAAIILNSGRPNAFIYFQF